MVLRIGRTRTYICRIGTVEIYRPKALTPLKSNHLISNKENQLPGVHQVPNSSSLILMALPKAVITKLKPMASSKIIEALESLNANNISHEINNLANLQELQGVIGLIDAKDMNLKDLMVEEYSKVAIKLLKQSLSM